MQLTAELSCEQHESIQKTVNDITLNAAKQFRRNKVEMVHDADFVDKLTLQALSWTKAADMTLQAAQACLVTMNAYNDTAKTNTLDASDKAFSTATDTISLLKELEKMVFAVQFRGTEFYGSASYDATFNEAYAAAYDIVFQALSEESFVRIRSLWGSVEERAKPLAASIAKSAAMKAEEAFRCWFSISTIFSEIDQTFNDFHLWQEIDKISQATDIASNAADTYGAYSDAKDEPKAAIDGFVEAAAGARKAAHAATRTYTETRRYLLKLANQCSRVAKIYAKAASDLKAAQVKALANLKTS